MIHIRYSSADILKSLLGEYLFSLTAALLPVGYISSRICWFGHPSCQGRCFPSSVKYSILSLTAVTWVWLAVLTYFTSVAQRELFNSQPPDDDSRSRSVRRASYQQVASCHSPVHCVIGVAVINACCEILLQLSPCCLLSLDCTLIDGRASDWCCRLIYCKRTISQWLPYIYETQTRFFRSPVCSIAYIAKCALSDYYSS